MTDRPTDWHTLIIGHSIGAIDNPVTRFILAFHMPLFFFISGMVCYGKQMPTFRIFLIRKIKTILIPQIVLASFTIAMNILIRVVIIKECQLNELDYISPFKAWFLPTLFLTQIPMFFLAKYSRNRAVPLLYLIFAGILFFLFNNNTVLLFQQFFCGVFFVTLGYYMRKVCDAYNLCFRYKGWSFWLFIVVAYLSQLNMPIGMYMNQYGNKLLFLVIAILGIVASVDFSILISSSWIFQFIGFNSVIIYVTQSPYIAFIKGFLNDIILIKDYKIFPYYLLIVFILSLIEIPTIYIANRYLWFAFGKHRVKSVLMFNKSKSEQLIKEYQ